jgi:hypothetical protein
MDKQQYDRAREIQREIEYLKESGVGHFQRQFPYIPMRIDIAHAEEMLETLKPIFEVYQKSSIAVIERRIKELGEEFVGL